MARIACLLPEAELVPLALQLAQQCELDLAEIKYVSIDHTIAETHRQRAAGIDIFIAGSVQAEMIKRTLSVPVVTLEMSGMELADVLITARAMQGQSAHVGLITGLVTPRSQFKLRHQAEHFEFPISSYCAVTREEHRACMEQAVQEGVTVFCGGHLTREIAHEMGYPVLRPKIGEESMLEAFATAIEVARAVDFEKNHNEEFHAWLDYSPNGTIKIGPDGAIQLCNQYVENLLHFNEEQLRDHSITEFFPEVTAQELERVFLKGEERFLRVAVHEEEISLNIIPMGGKQQRPANALVFLHDSSRVQKLQASFADPAKGRHLPAHTFATMPNTSASFAKTTANARLLLNFTKVLHISGPYGTEKRYLAEAIHNEANSGRPFLAAYCTAMDKGAGNAEHFYGQGLPSDPDLAKLCAESAGGTLFLDGLSRLSYQNQHYLYDVLMQHSYVYPAANSPLVELPWLIITGDRTPLGQLYREGRLITSLYYLLGSAQLLIPPMSDRPEDVEAWWSHFLRRDEERYGRYIKLTQEALQVLRDHPWNGGLHEIRAVVRATLIQSPKRSVDAAFVQGILRQCADPNVTNPQAPPAAPMNPQAQRLLEALRANGGNRAAAARQLGISTTTLWRRIKNYHLNPEDWI